MKSAKDLDFSPPEPELIKPAAVVPKTRPTKADAFDLKAVLARLPEAAQPREDPGNKRCYCVPICETTVQVLLDRSAYYIVDPPDKADLQGYTKNGKGAVHIGWKHNPLNAWATVCKIAGTREGCDVV